MRAVLIAMVLAAGCGSTGGVMPMPDMADGGSRDLATVDLLTSVDAAADMASRCAPGQIYTSEGTCIACGGVGQPCCDGLTCNAAARVSCEERAPGASYVDQCNACGYPGQRCCTPLGIVTRACADADTMCGSNGMCP